MVDQIIRPAALPRRTNPVAAEIVPVDNGAQVAGSTLAEIVNAGAPVASQAEAAAGSNNTKRMTPLTTKQSIASEVGVTLASKAQGDKADSAVPDSRSISAGTGLSGGGDLTENRTLSLSSSSITSLAKADTAVQPESLGALAGKSSINNSDWSGTPLAPQNGGVVPGGTIGQAYIKASGDDYDGSWQDVAAATAVSYAPQVLNESQKSQARANIGALARDGSDVGDEVAQAAFRAAIGAAAENIEIRPHFWYGQKTDAATTTSSTWADTGLQVIAQASKMDSSIVIQADLSGVGGANATNTAQFRVVRGSTVISAAGDSAGTRTQALAEIPSNNALGGASTGHVSVTAVDDPASLDPQTYKIQWRVSAGTAYLNRSANDTNSDAYSRTASTITAMEVIRP